MHCPPCLCGSRHTWVGTESLPPCPLGPGLVQSPGHRDPDGWVGKFEEGAGFACWVAGTSPRNDSAGRAAERPGHQLLVGPVLRFASSEEPGHEGSSLGNVVARNSFTWSPRLSRCGGQGREGRTWRQTGRGPSSR